MQGLRSLFRTFLIYFLWKNVYCQNLNPATDYQQRESPISAKLSKNISLDALADALAQADRNIAEIGGLKTGTFRCPFASKIHQQHNPQQVSYNKKKSGTNQEKFEIAIKILKKKYNLTDESLKLSLSRIDIRQISPNNTDQNCTDDLDINCQSRSRYRTFDGTCNNLRNPSWGMAASCFARLMRPVYADDISELRLALSGRTLPLPRTISLRIHPHVDNPTDYTNHLFMQIGQLLTHDLSLASLQVGNDNQIINCCPEGSNNNPQCAPIEISRNDPFYSSLGVDCLNNARTIICPTCAFGPRQQMSQPTAFIDASVIYGSNSIVANALRTMNDGLLRTQAGNLLPESLFPENDGCSFQMRNRSCFEAGDERVNTHVALTSLHTIFLRQHNNIARKLNKLNPRWDDERLYQESRRIVGAQFQVIVYKEYLPLLIGQERMNYFNLNIQSGNTYTYYNLNTNPMITTEFAAGAFRFAHSMINRFFPQIPRQVVDSTNRLRDLYFWPFYLYTNGYLESIVRGMLRSSGQKFDRYVVPDVSNHLFQIRGNRSGLDLTALDIFRGRDHGLPPYVDVVRYCGGPTINSFYDLDQLFHGGYRQRFQEVYENVNDIDFFSGGMAERYNPGAIIGPTFTCVIGIQFSRLKFGDRFYFEHGRQRGSFTLDQLYELKKTIFSKIICDNTYIDTIQQEALKYPGNGNQEFRCNYLPELDLNAWIE